MKVRIHLFIFVAVVFSIYGCKQPPVGVKLSFDNYKIEEGFAIELAASDPFIEAPIGIDFDNKGRMWVVEMRGFMPDLNGTGDDAPVGRISILEDTDNDGYAETSKVFLDSLVLPRSLSLVYGGLLYTEPPFLRFVEIINDKPGKITLIDSTYAEGGSPEAQANGLMMNIDNWIYSANSQYRYQLRDGKWLREPTPFRGQFGISKDDYGRLYYNYNTIQIAGDYVLPNTMTGNRYYKPSESINKVLTRNQRVYPLHATTVNRGYVEGVLDKDSMLLNVTAACGPLIYRGGTFPLAYHQNAFTCEPQANLVKRNILTFKDDSTIATQAWDDREFLASTDEGFRPVNLFNGPDGAMYVVDMHRGVMEYRAFTTPYYNERIAAKKLDTLLSAGRVLRIVRKDQPRNEIPDLTKRSTDQLVQLLKNNNGWLRDRAQHLLVHQNDKKAIPALQRLLETDSNAITAIHVLHTLNALNGLSFQMLQQYAGADDAMLASHALLLMDQFATNENVQQMVQLSEVLLKRNNGVINLYLPAALGKWNEISPASFVPVMMKLFRQVPAKAIYQEAIVSGLAGLENEIRDSLAMFVKQERGGKRPERAQIMDSLLALTVKNMAEKKMNPIFAEARTPVDARTNGLTLFRNNCASCHGADGAGIELVAPPLTGSEYVSGSTSRLAMIILYGLEGPIHINGQLYKFNNTMPTFAGNLSNDQIVDIIRFMHNAYVNTPVKPITADDVEKLRSKKLGTLKESDLLKLENGAK